MDLFTLIHIGISLAGIAAGFVVVGGWMAGRSFRNWTSLFLGATVLTSVTGFFFPIHGLTPGLAVGAISLVVLAVTFYALGVGRLAGKWRTVYVITATVALYLNFFVLVAQIFQKTPALKVLAPTQSEPPFAVAQGLVFLLFVFLGIGVVRGFRSIPTTGSVS